MLTERTIRFVFFALFFVVGTVTLTVNILHDELVTYYQHQDILADANNTLQKLEALDKDYDALIESIRNDPNLLQKAAATKWAINDDDPNSVIPKFTPAELEAARKTLTKDSPPDANTTPQWLLRCSEPKKRRALLVCSAALILIAFACLGPTRKNKTINQPESIEEDLEKE